MSDEVAKQFEAEPPLLKSEGRSVTLSVTLHPNNEIYFQLPMGNKVLAYGLLEVARAQLDKLYFMHEMKTTQASRGGIEGLLKRMNGG